MQQVLARELANFLPELMRAQDERHIGLPFKIGEPQHPRVAVR